MKILFTIIFTSFGLLLAAQNDSNKSALPNTHWNLTSAQYCQLDIDDVISECSDTIDMLEKQTGITFLSESKALFFDKEFYYWMPTQDSLLLAIENWGRNGQTPTVGYMDFVFIVRKRDETLFLEETTTGVYGEFGDFSYGEINRYFFVKN